MLNISKKLSDLNEKWNATMTIIESANYTLGKHQELADLLEKSGLDDETGLQFEGTFGEIYPNKKVAQKIAEDLLRSGKKELVANLKTLEKIEGDLMSLIAECKKDIETEV